MHEKLHLLIGWDHFNYLCCTLIIVLSWLLPIRIEVNVIVVKCALHCSFRRDRMSASAAATLCSGCCLSRTMHPAAFRNEIDKIWYSIAAPPLTNLATALLLIHKQHLVQSIKIVLCCKYSQHFHQCSTCMFTIVSAIICDKSHLATAKISKASLFGYVI